MQSQVTSSLSTIVVATVSLCLVGWAGVSDVNGQGTIPALPSDDLPESLPWDSVPRGLKFRVTLPGNVDQQQMRQRIALGRRLFYDPVLSVDRTLSCASCHQAQYAFASNTAVSTGVGGKQGTRNSPTLFNVALGDRFFWDGRADSLEHQALMPIENPIELATTVPGVLGEISKDETYVSQFRAAYGSVNRDNLARALADFQRVLLSGDSDVDRFHAGQYASLSPSARQGMWIFESNGRCWKCHSGPNFTDQKFHNTGVSWGSADLGRFDVTQAEADRGKFKTPTLRNIALTAPYMHDGSLKTLADVVKFYSEGGKKNPHLDREMEPLNLSADDQQHLVAYLQALTGRAAWDADVQLEQADDATVSATGSNE